MDILIGKWATAVRQVIDAAAQFTGVAPKVVGPPIVPFIPQYASSVFTMTHPTVAATPADDGGLFYLGPENSAKPDYSVRIIEFHLVCGAGGKVDISIVDAVTGVPARVLYTAEAAANVRLAPTIPVYVLPGQTVKIVESTKGVPVSGDKYLTIYAIQEGRI